MSDKSLCTLLCLTVAVLAAMVAAVVHGLYAASAYAYSSAVAGTAGAVDALNQVGNFLAKLVG
jgi:hypothetical protein